MGSDKRKNYTKKLLDTSLLKFLRKKPLARITIKEICEDVEINRSTYYLYYLDPYDQLNKIEENIFYGMTEYVDSISIQNATNETAQLEIIKGILQYIQDNRNTFEVLFQNSDTNFQQDILKFFAQRLFGSKATSFEEIDLKYVYCSTGSYAIIYSWITYNLQIGIDDLAKIIVKQNLGVK